MRFAAGQGRSPRGSRSRPRDMGSALLALREYVGLRSLDRGALVGVFGLDDARAVRFAPAAGLLIVLGLGDRVAANEARAPLLTLRCLGRIARPVYIVGLAPALEHERFQLANVPHLSDGSPPHGELLAHLGRGAALRRATSSRRHSR